MTLSSGRRGFTLVELLVVIAIIGVLVALLLPAVQAARESARRMQCSNNLKQMAIGIHNFHDTRLLFPHNTLPTSNWADQSGGKNWSWISRILPFMEQQNLYNNLDIENKTLRQSQVYVATQVKTFLCPSDDYTRRGPRTDGHNLGTPAISPPLPLGQTNYKGVSGANWQWGEARWNPIVSTIDGTSKDGLVAGDGLFYRKDDLKKLRMASITDGTSNTFMVGEDLPQKNTHCSWPYANHSNGTCAIWPNSKKTNGTEFTPTDWPNVYSFRSAHPNGLQFAFADGSVRFVPNSIDIAIYRALSTIAGNETSQLP